MSWMVFHKFISDFSCCVLVLGEWKVMAIDTNAPKIAIMTSVVEFECLTDSHLFCTLISENQGLEKLGSVSNLRKISGPAKLNFFQYT